MCNRARKPFEYLFKYQPQQYIGHMQYAYNPNKNTSNSFIEFVFDVRLYW